MLSDQPPADRRVEVEVEVKVGAPRPSSVPLPRGFTHVSRLTSGSHAH